MEGSRAVTKTNRFLQSTSEQCDISLHIVCCLAVGRTHGYDHLWKDSTGVSTK